MTVGSTSSHESCSSTWGGGGGGFLYPEIGVLLQKKRDRQRAKEEVHHLLDQWSADVDGSNENALPHAMMMMLVCCVNFLLPNKYATYLQTYLPLCQHLKSLEEA